MSVSGAADLLLTFCFCWLPLEGSKYWILNYIRMGKEQENFEGYLKCSFYIKTNIVIPICMSDLALSLITPTTNPRFYPRSRVIIPNCLSHRLVVLLSPTRQHCTQPSPINSSFNTH